MGSEPVKTFFEEQEAATLTTLCKGYIPELFQREFLKAIENAMDVNTPWKGKRKVKLVVTIQPNEERDAYAVTAETSSTLAPFLGESGTVFAAKRGSEILAVNYRADQMKLPLEKPALVKTDAPPAATKTTDKAATA